MNSRLTFNPLDGSELLAQQRSTIAERMEGLKNQKHESGSTVSSGVIVAIALIAAGLLTFGILAWRKKQRDTAAEVQSMVHKQKRARAAAPPAPQKPTPAPRPISKPPAAKRTTGTRSRT